MTQGISRPFGFKPTINPKSNYNIPSGYGLKMEGHNDDDIEDILSGKKQYVQKLVKDKTIEILN